jgi:hypothetical protein
MQVGPGQRPIHHLRPERFDERLGSAENVGIDGLHELRSAFHGHAIPYRADAVEMHPPSGIFILRTYFLYFSLVLRIFYTAR